MKIVIASGNKGKIKEFKQILPDDEVIAYSELLGDIQIEEDKDTFKDNAIKKAKTIYKELDKIGINNIVVISDDSGISLPVLNGKPGIYSARYAGENATSKDNNLKLINELEKLGLKKTKAYYTACIALVYKNQVYTVHGWMHGDVIIEQKGENGFGYDPLFIPNGYNNTLGELEDEVKKSFSHRSKALRLAQKVLGVIK